jgi:dTDP-4-amino-4,6-dideoxygalactose transaminase
MVALRGLLGQPRGSRREILMPAFTFAAPINAVLWAGFGPVFVDVEPRSWHLDPTSLVRALESRKATVAGVLACSTFGVPPPAHQRLAWEEAVRAAAVPLLVDSAAGFGAAADDGVVLGSQGNIEVFSFHATKPFAIGEGGLVTTANDELARRVEQLVNFGFENRVVSGDVGLNAKLSEWSAATALAVLDGYQDVLTQRRARARHMIDGLEQAGYQLQAGIDGAVWQFVPVLAPTAAVRTAALEIARRDGIEVRSYFSVPLHRMRAFKSVPIADELRCTDDLARRVLSLPMANDLSRDDGDAIVACLLASLVAA